MTAEAVVLSGRPDAGAEPFERGEPARRFVASLQELLAEGFVSWLLPEWRQQPEPDIAGCDFAGKRVPLFVDAHWFPLNGFPSVSHRTRLRREI